MLILLPPSEGKTAPRRGKPLDLSRLSFPSLTEGRAQVLDALASLCTDDAAKAAEVLGLGPTQADEVARNGSLSTAPTARADMVYSGVLYDALDVASLDASAKRRASSRVAVTSGLFGLLRLGDPIPAYRLSGTVSLPALGVVSRHWSHHLALAVEESAGSGVIIDLRSSMYTPFWRPTKEQSNRVVTVRVLHEVDGRRTVVSHFNKATKGRLVRALLQDGSVPRRPDDLVDLLSDLGWTVEAPASRIGRPTSIDVVVSDAYALGHVK